jgi:hypothetical protein
VTIRPRAARNLREIRSRLRDVAAAAHAGKVAVRDHRTAALADRQAELEAQLDDAQYQLAGATSIYALESVNEDTGAHRLVVLDAARDLEDATKETRISEQALRERARQLRSAERVVEELEKQTTRREAVAEQRAQDDMSARRR